MLFSVFERAKVQIISIASEKMLFFVKNNSLICSCLFDGECLFLRSNFAIEFFNCKIGNRCLIN